MLCSFVERNGSARKVQLLDVFDNYPLGQWVNKQRRQYKRGVLRPERVARLEAVPGWVWNEHDALWEEAYEALLAYVSRGGSVETVPPSTVENGIRLGRWVAKQRGAGRAGRLEADRVRRLELVPGWRWRPARGRWAVE